MRLLSFETTPQAADPVPRIEYDATLQRVAVGETALKGLYELLVQHGAQVAMPPEGTPVSDEGDYLLSYRAAQSIIDALSSPERQGIGPLEWRLEKAARALVSAAMYEAITLGAGATPPEDDKGAHTLYSAFSNQVVLDFEDHPVRRLQVSDERVEEQAQDEQPAYSLTSLERTG